MVCVQNAFSYRRETLCNTLKAEKNRMNIILVEFEVIKKENQPKY